MSHIHFVSNDKAKTRLLQMGEIPDSIFVIGSPDVDVMFSNDLPNLREVKKYYDIEFSEYAMAIFHPVTTEFEELKSQINEFVEAIKESEDNYIMIYPNNDLGSNIILEAIKGLNEGLRFRVFPSLRFEYFLVLLKNSNYIIGNSSAGIREAPYYGVSTINIGSRQRNRIKDDSIINVESNKNLILKAIQNIDRIQNKPITNFGQGKSASLFLESLMSDSLWEINHQKQFVDKEYD